jgi:regulator of nucleoside diphosphate kinase
MTTEQALARPPILITETEAESLADLAISLAARHPVASRLLLEELERAEVVPTVPDDVVTMGSMVEFAVAGTGERRRVELVFPGDADIAEGRISILTPMGAGLIGLRVGQTISWPDLSGHERLLTIESVSRPR